MRSRATLGVFMAFAGLIFFCTPVEATWYWTHGSSGHVEDETAVASVFHRGNGLEVNPSFDSIGWAHFTVPTIGEKLQGARFVTIRFNILNALNSGITRVRVYDGGVLVKAFIVDWHSPGPQSQTLDLESIVSFRTGMGVSIRFESGPDSGIDKYIFMGVGANFVAKP